MAKQKPKAKPDFKKLTADYLAGEEKLPATDDPIALIERLCPVMRKHGVFRVKLAGIELEITAPPAYSSFPVAYAPVEATAAQQTPEPLKDEPRGDDGLTKAEADELYAASA